MCSICLTKEQPQNAYSGNENASGKCKMRARMIIRNRLITVKSIKQYERGEWENDFSMVANIDFAHSYIFGFVIGTMMRASKQSSEMNYSKEEISQGKSTTLMKDK